MTEDLSVFLADFGVSVTPEAGSAFTGIFDAAYLASMGVVESSGPVLVVRSQDVIGNGIEQESILTISGADYIVTGVQPDGTGVTTLQLRGVG